MALTGTYIGDGIIRWEISGVNPSDFDYFRIETSDGVSETSTSTTIYTSGHALGTYVTGDAYGVYGADYYLGSDTVYIPLPPRPIGAPIITHLEALYQNGQHRIRVEWDASDVIGENVRYNVYANGVWKGSTSGTSLTIEVDYEYTVYNIEVYPYNEAGEGYDYGWGSIRTLDVTPPTIYDFYIDNLTAVSARANVEAYDGMSGVNRYVYYLNGTLYTTDYTSATSMINITNLNPNTTYSLKVVVYDNQGNYQEETQTFTTPAQSTRPANFTWQYSTIAAGQPAAIDHRDWNNLGARINQFRAYKGFPTLNFVQVSQGDILYASYFNSFRDAIAAMNPPTLPPGTKVSGDVVYAADILLLATSLNSIP